MYNNRIETFTLSNDITVETFQDDFYSNNPRETCDHFGTMLCGHPRYNLGDKQIKTEEELKFLNDREYISLPLYLYDHSGLVISTERKGVFACPWDTSYVGKIYVSKSKVRETYSVKRITPEIKKRAIEVLKGEVEEYSNYLAGNVFGFVAENADGDIIESCGGYVMDYDDFKEMITAELS